MRRHTGKLRAGAAPRWPVILITVGILGVTTTGLMALRAGPASNLARLQSTQDKLSAQASAPVAPLAQPKTVATAPTTPADATALAEDLNAYLSEQEGTYGLSVIDLTTGQRIAINADQSFRTASTFKLPMAMYILNQVQAGRAGLTDEIAYTSSDYEDGTGSLQDYVAEGDTYTVKDLVTLAITESDNIATNMLLRHFGRDTVIEYARSVGATGTTLIDGEPVSTPQDMALFMKLAQSPEGVANPNLRTFLTDLLSQTVFHDRVEAGVPTGVRVAHKIGTLPNVVNDVGLVYAPGHTFVIAVLSSDVNDEVAPDVIAEVTRRVYNYETGQAPTSASVTEPATGNHAG